MKVGGLYRHPVKSHGREALDAVTLRAGEPMPFDRLWAIAHDQSRAEPGDWAACVNFSRVSKAPALMAITAVYDEGRGTLTLSHPKRPDITLDPDTEGAALVEWTLPLVPQDRAQPAQVLRLGGRGYTDSDFPSVTLCNSASHRAVEDRMGRTLSIHRWRGNIWIDDADPWAEFDWIGREIAVGDAVLRGVERTDRCLATTANPDTGARDADTLAALDGFGHRDFSIRCEVLQGGDVRLGDPVAPR